MHRSRRSQSGQATVEWSALSFLLALLLAVFALLLARADAWRFAESIVHGIACAVDGDCEQGDSLDDAYGSEVAALVRKHSPSIGYERSSAALPIDFRRCRKTDCSDGSDRAAAIAISRAGLPVTAFTRVVDRRDAGGALYLQYWLYYPESFTGGIGRPLGDDWPGYHADDWEGVQVRISPDGRVSGRATSHGGYDGGWRPWTGWLRVSGGSHAGWVGERPDGERTTPADQLALVPLERLRGAERHSFEVTPPWRKDVYTSPESPGS